MMVDQNHSPTVFFLMDVLDGWKMLIKIIKDDTSIKPRRGRDRRPVLCPIELGVRTIAAADCEARLNDVRCLPCAVSSM